jgi:hypothetical protein
MEIFKVKGVYIASGKIELETFKTLNWRDLFDNNPPELPEGSVLEFILSLEINDFLNGRNGIIWATYDFRQAEIIQSTLLAQQVSSEVITVDLSKVKIFLLKILNESDVSEAINFVWKNDTGLRLKPDWSYPEGEKNKSFEQWLSGQ